MLGLSQALLGLTVPLWVVSSAKRFVGFAVAPPAALGAGILSDLIGIRETLLVSAVIAAVAFLYFFFSPVRRFHHPAS